MGFDKYKEFVDNIKTGKQILSEIERHDAKVREDSRCDKHGLGFNLDDRFSSARIVLDVCGWRGYYGKSGCSAIPIVRKKDVFEKAFVMVMNRKFREIMGLVAEEIITSNERLRDEAVAELEAALNELNGERDGK